MRKKKWPPPAIIRGNTVSTADTRFTDTHLIPTPYYYGQFSLSLGKVLSFSLNSARLIRTPVSADKGHLFLPNKQIPMEIQPHS